MIVNEFAGGKFVRFLRATWQKFDEYFPNRPLPLERNCNDIVRQKETFAVIYWFEIDAAEGVCTYSLENGNTFVSTTKGERECTCLSSMNRNSICAVRVLD